MLLTRNIKNHCSLVFLYVIIFRQKDFWSLKIIFPLARGHLNLYSIRFAKINTLHNHDFIFDLLTFWCWAMNRQRHFAFVKKEFFNSVIITAIFFIQKQECVYVLQSMNYYKKYIICFNQTYIVSHSKFYWDSEIS